MNAKSTSDERLELVDAPAGANRMKIVGLLSKKGVTVAELAAMLERRPSAISHQLSRHARTGLVSPRAERHYSVYKLETDALEGRVK